MNDQDYSYLKSKIYKITNLDINCYKGQQMRRRLDAFIAKQYFPTIVAYCNMLEGNRDKQRELLDYMAINVSEFFRDLPQYKILYQEVLPNLLSSSPRLNIWSAACSSGQEPYSIAILLEESCPSHKHRIVATDIDESALEQARNGGPYTNYDTRNVEKYRLEKYFVKKETGYWIDERIKKKVTFHHHNILNDIFEQNFDLIVCRNVIIYFSEEVRDSLFKKFHNSLKSSGILFLGGSEVVLRPWDQGYQMIYPAFYHKIGNASAGNHSSHNFSEVVL
jgi:chemotaxis protein methyltransferase CheR